MKQGRADCTSFNIPQTLWFASEVTDEHKFRATLDHIRVQNGVIFGLIRLLGELSGESEIDNLVELGEYLELLSEIGNGFQQAWEQTVMDRERSASSDPESSDQAEELTQDEIEAEETFERFNHHRGLAEEYNAHQLAAALVDHPEFDTKTQRKIFEFIAGNQILPADDVKELATVTGFEYKPGPKNEYTDLAAHLSAVLTDPKTPKKMYELLHTQIYEMQTPDELIDSPDYIERHLAEEAGNVG